MTIPSQLKVNGNIKVFLSSNAQTILPLYHIVFKKWVEISPIFNFGGKPIVNYQDKPVFAELAILKLFIDSGWDGVWVEPYGGIHFLKDMPKSWKLAQSHISIPKDKETFLRNIQEVGKTTACFDVFVWKDNDILFCESKHKGKDRLTNAQIKFIEGALSCGVPEKSLLIAEWEYYEKNQPKNREIKNGRKIKTLNFRQSI